MTARLYVSEAQRIATDAGLVMWSANNTGDLTLARLVAGASRRARAAESRFHDEIAEERILKQWRGIVNSRAAFLATVSELSGGAA